MGPSARPLTLSAQGGAVRYLTLNFHTCMCNDKGMIKILILFYLWFKMSIQITHDVILRQSYISPGHTNLSDHIL